MDAKTKTKLALADAIAQAMWIKGLITTEERDRINQYCYETLLESNC